MTTIEKYSIKDFNNIIFDGFDFKLPDETVNLISELSLEVGSPSYIKTPVFKKKENHLLKNAVPGVPSVDGNTPHMNILLDNAITSSHAYQYKKRRGRNTEIVNDEDWESLRSFHTTVIEQKVGIDVHIDLIRSNLNKMSDKNYEDLKNKIIDVIDTLIENDVTNENLLLVSTSIFEIASTNRFYSKLYADLYCDLINKYDFMKEVFEKSFYSFMDVFTQIDYVDPDKDYDRFCKINKDNEKRKSLSAFFVNLTLNGLITKEELLKVVCNLIKKVFEFIVLENKKNEVDEMTENIALLCVNKTILENKEFIVLDGLIIEDTIRKLANSKSKKYPSLSNKSIFKYMDMIDM
jgi:hypothetical protein